MFPASCLQLSETKSTDRKQTLLHFIVSIIQEKYPEVQSFYSELHFLDKASMGEHEHFLISPPGGVTRPSYTCSGRLRVLVALVERYPPDS